MSAHDGDFDFCYPMTPLCCQTLEKETTLYCQLTGLGTNIDLCIK